jgi:heat shock protein HtpX
VLNTIIIGILLSSLFHASNTVVTFLLGLGVYAVSLVIALSPVGECILRMQSGYKAIKRKDQIDCIEPIFKEVLEKARGLDPSIPADVKLYINNSSDVNCYRKKNCLYYRRNVKRSKRRNKSNPGS